ncbi:hypothetical protein GQ42DRAFT_160817 [Ramicandelaber brevisporus]|nr:hypothetical protein GQ42DRAFT_160817 [Ramicandelaber brevisporus]
MTSKNSSAAAVVNPNYEVQPYKLGGYKSFLDFYPYYLGEHSLRTTRLLHLVGTFNNLLCLAAAIVLKKPKLAGLGVIQAYAFAWIGHFFFEKNKPATFKHPLYSLMGDHYMLFEILRGRRSP